MISIIKTIKKSDLQGIFSMKQTILIAFLAIACQLSAQKTAKEKRAEELYSFYNFKEAIEKYNELDTLSIEGYRNLASAYSNIGNHPKAEETYKRFIENSAATTDDFFNYASVLKINKKYDEADRWMEKFASSNPSDLRGKDFSANRKLIKEIMVDQGKFTITNLDINSIEDDFGAAFFGKKVVFASSRGGSPLVNRSYNWNNKPFLDLYIAENQEKQLKNVKPLNKKLNKKYHEGPACFASKNTYMAFTRNNYYGKSSQGIVKLQIFFMTLINGKWQNEQSFSLNSSEYSVGHPYLLEDGSTMYFASDMPGGFGGSDIYRISKTQDGVWGEPVNLGDKVNTEANEMFPFIDEKNNLLFFASNGHVGLGGLDLFVGPLMNGRVSKVINAGAPLNSPFDDFALILDSNSGFFSSNRAEGKGGDDLYSLDLLKPFVFQTRVEGIVKNQKGDPLPGATVQVKNGSEVITLKADSQGLFSFLSSPNETYSLLGQLNQYQDKQATITVDGVSPLKSVEIVLEKEPETSLYCQVTEKESKQAIADVKLILMNKNTGLADTVTTDGSGEFIKPLLDVKLNDRLNYKLTLTKVGYLTKTVEYSALIDHLGRYDVAAMIDLSLEKASVGADLAKLINVKPIYFDLGKSVIRKDAAIELDKIVKVMNENPTMIIELGSHTDCRGTMTSNEKLSAARAKSSAEYVQKKISKPERIYGKGYGESKLKNGCSCEGVIKSTCTEADHQENRRTEFIIIKM